MSGGKDFFSSFYKITKTPGIFQLRGELLDYRICAFSVLIGTPKLLSKAVVPDHLLTMIWCIIYMPGRDSGTGDAAVKKTKISALAKFTF